MQDKDYKSLSRGVSDDMSPEAISRRLDIVSELYDLYLSLKKSRRLCQVEEILFIEGRFGRVQTNDIYSFIVLFDMPKQLDCPVPKFVGGHSSKLEGALEEYAYGCFARSVF